MSMNKILKYVCLAGLFLIPLLPLYVANGMFFPFITGKNFAFRIIVEIIFAAWAVLAITDTSYRPRKSWLLWSLVAFTGIMLLADITSVYAFKSIWSNYERMEGWVGLAHLLGFFLVAGHVLTRELWDSFLQTTIGVGLVTIVYSLFQITGLAKINQGGARIDATFGNSTYLAVYSLFILFFCFLFLVRKREEFNSRRHIFLFYAFNVGFLFFVMPMLHMIVTAPELLSSLRAWAVISLLVVNALLFLSAFMERGKILYAAIAVFEFILIYNTQTRGAMLGFLGGIILASLLIAIFERGHSKIRKAAIAGVIIPVILIIAFIAVRNTQFVRQSQTLSRLASISLSDNTTKSRFLLWNMAWKGALERPVLGWGQESFNYVFNKNYDPRMYNQEQWFDRTHNVIMDWLISGGFLGLIAYLSVFAAVLWYVWKRDARNDFAVVEKSILTGLLAGYFIHNLFVFDNLTSYILYSAVAAYVYTRRSVLYHGAGGHHRHVPNRVIAPVVLVATCFLVYYVNIPPILANYSLIAALNSRTINESMDRFKQAIAYGSFGTAEVREQVFARLDQITFSEQTPDVIQAKAAFYPFAKSEALKQIERTPNDARYYIFPGASFAHAGRFDDALPFLKKAAELSPKKQSILYELGSAYWGKQDYQTAFGIFRSAYEAEPSNELARQLYAAAAIYVRNDTLADELLKSYTPQEIARLDSVLRAYYATNNTKKVLEMWKIRVADDPNNASLHVSLAAAYLMAKDQKKAIAELQEAIRLEPAFKEQGEGYIRQIRAGTLK